MDKLNPLQKAAKKMQSNFISSVPFNIHTNPKTGKKEKWPAIKDVATFQSRLPTETEILNMYSKCNAIAMCTGRLQMQNDYIVVIDFDSNKHTDIKEIFESYMDIEDIKEIFEDHKIPINKTISGGFHIFFRTKTEVHSSKLSMKGQGMSRETEIETRGVGGMLIVPPTRGYSKYLNDFTKIPLLSEEETEIMLIAARTFDEPKEDDKENRTDFEKHTFSPNGKRPGDIYNRSHEARSDVENILRELGWKETSKSRGYWLRPGKEKGASAILNKGTNIFTNYSSNAYDFEAKKGYSPYAMLTKFKFNGDPSACAKYLYKRGFKDPNFAMAGRRKHIMKVATKCLMNGISLENTKRSEIPEICNDYDFEPKEVYEAFKSIYEDKKDLAGINKDKNPAVRTIAFLKHQYPQKFRYNVIKDVPEMEIEKGKWEIIDTSSIWLDLKTEYSKADKDAFTSFFKSRNDKYIEQYDAFASYFQNLEPKDNGMIAKVCECFDFVKFGKNKSKKKIEENQVLRNKFQISFTKHCIRLLHNATDENAINRYIFMLVGGEEIGKTSFIRWLNPFPNMEYITEEPYNPNDKDVRSAPSRNLIYNLEELEDLDSKSDAALKQLLSSRYAVLRRAWRDNDVKYVFRASFFGSSNNEKLLELGENSRFLIHKVTHINFDYSKLDIHAFWANVKYQIKKYATGELTKDEKRAQKEENRKYLKDDIVKHYAAQCLIPTDDVVDEQGNIVGERMALIEIIAYIHKFIPNERISVVKMGKILKTALSMQSVKVCLARTSITYYYCKKNPYFYGYK